MSTRRAMAAIGSVVIALSITGCGEANGDLSPSRDDEPLELSDNATITYRFGDSSVPPEYHRSFEITVTIDKVLVVVDSYGDVLADESVELDSDVWEELQDTFESVQGLDVERGDIGCTGGTSRSLLVEDGNEELVDLDIDVCGGTNEDAADAVEEWIEPVLQAVDIETLTE